MKSNCMEGFVICDSGRVWWNVAKPPGIYSTYDILEHSN